jgi:hypothetical protein
MRYLDRGKTLGGLIRLLTEIVDLETSKVTLFLRIVNSKLRMNAALVGVNFFGLCSED